MLGPIFRSLSTFVFVIGFLAGSTGAYALFFQGDPLRFGILLGVALIFIIAALKMREATEELNLVAISPEDMVHQFEISVALGLGARASASKTALAGTGAAALIVIAVALAGWITDRAFLLSLVIISVYGGLLALAKQRALAQGAFSIKDGKRFGAHRRLSVVVIPAITVVWLVLSAPEADPLILAIIALGLLWWIGAAFHRAWELVHTTILVLLYGEKNPQTIRWGLIEWLKYTRADARVRAVEFVSGGQVTLHGEFDNPDELRRDLLRLDFVNNVRVVEERDPAAGGGTSR